MHVVTFPFFTLLVFGLLVATCFAMFYHVVQKNTSTAWSLLTIGIVVLIAIPVLFLLVPLQLHRTHSESARLSPLSASSDPILDVVHDSVYATKAWEDLNEGLFSASSYHAFVDTAKPLAHRVRSAIVQAQLLSADEDGNLTEPSELRIVPHRLQEYRDSIRAPFLSELRQLFPENTEIKWQEADENVSPTGELEAGVVVLKLSLPDLVHQTAPWDPVNLETRGTHRCDITTSVGTAMADCQYVDKPWVGNLDVFISSQPHRKLIVGYSGSLSSSESEARRLAMKDAQGQYRLIINGQHAVTPNESLVVDRFAQKLSRPYGDVWREAVLLDVTESRMDPLIAATVEKHGLLVTQRVSLLGGLLLLIAVTAGLCVTLNLLTHGYYRERLALGCAAATGMVILALAFVA